RIASLDDIDGPNIALSKPVLKPFFAGRLVHDCDFDCDLFGAISAKRERVANLRASVFDGFRKADAPKPMSGPARVLQIDIGAGLGVLGIAKLRPTSIDHNTGNSGSMIDANGAFELVGAGVKLNRIA